MAVSSSASAKESQRSSQPRNFHPGLIQANRGFGGLPRTLFLISKQTQLLIALDTRHGNSHPQKSRFSRADLQGPVHQSYLVIDRLKLEFEAQSASSEFVILPTSSFANIKYHQTLPAKNGLCCFSSPTVVIGPCPGQMIVSFGNVRIFSTLLRSASW